MKLSLLRAAVLAASLFGGVATRAAVVERPLTAVSLDTTLSDAYKLAARHPGAQVLRIEGQSMLPFFGEGSVVIVKKIESARLRPGMVVVYHNRFGETVAHRLVAPGMQGWVVQGYNNDATDSTLVTDSNLVGVVYVTFHSSGKIMNPLQVAALTSHTDVALAAPAK
jgi:signal peptidase I